MSQSRLRHVLVLNQFALPRTEGGGTRHVELFGRLRGWTSLIVAGNRNNYTRRKYHHRAPGFVTVPVTSYEGNGPKRILNWLSYTVGAIWVGLRQRHVDLVYASSPHLLTPLAGWFLAKVRRVPLVVEIRDLWPRSLVEFGFLREGSRLHRVLTAVEGFVYRQAARIVVVTTGWEDHFASFGLPPEKIVVVTNGAEPEDFVPTVDRDTARRELDVDGTVLVFAGAHGPKDGLDVVLDAAALVPNATFLLVGDGLEKKRLQQRARDEGLKNVRFLDPRPKERLADLFVACDVGLHIVAPVELFQKAMSPNKLYDYMAAGLPVITNAGGAMERLVLEAGCGLSAFARPGSDPARVLADCVEQLADQPVDERAAIGRRGRDYVERNASRTVMAARLEDVLDAATR
ncbi:glycosyltransferase family 4 protein [Thermasporomyces composti]|uniref:Glycosyltransferase involved in cell wall biosynthesis n=1 Tax=Thermasporomyces composti TaxID=696763 RepID=A0A3D9V5Y8_THECX|nr:glycosyltransferase family 4 protein [Thermasporomyces composti]REF36113.1 glycosyltransferase involved in cell wall biosynthesis [Thermasporomyces composti]